VECHPKNILKLSYLFISPYLFALSQLFRKRKKKCYFALRIQQLSSLILFLQTAWTDCAIFRDSFYAVDIVERNGLRNISAVKDVLQRSHYITILLSDEA